MGSNFKVFSDTGTNSYNDAQWDLLAERLSGFTQQSIASSKTTNTALKTATLIACALLQAVANDTATVGLGSTQTQISDYIKAGINIMANVPTATVNQNGISRPDNSTLQITNAGVVSVKEVAAGKITAGALGAEVTATPSANPASAHVVNVVIVPKAQLPAVGSQSAFPDDTIIVGYEP